MKKFTKLALTGALALGALAGIGSFDAKPASAAEKSAPVQAALPADSWGITDTWILNTQIDDMPAGYKSFLQPSYQSGSWFTILLPYDASHYNGVDQVKIFQVYDNGELSRIKTIDPQEVYDGEWKTVFQTQFNGNYPAGKYVAVSYVGGKHLKSDFFTVNK